MRFNLQYAVDDPRVLACKKAIKRAGGLTEVGRVFGVSPQAIYKWEVVPPNRCTEMELLSGISVHELRPDIFGPKNRKRQGRNRPALPEQSPAPR